MSIGRRKFLAGGAALPLAALPAAARNLVPAMPARATPFPLSAIRLRPSDFADAVEVNRAWLLRLDADRLLHNYRKFAGLTPKAKVYGGWESDTIAGHTLGHYLSGLALTHAQTGCTECATRAAYIVDELAACQSADGYVAGFTRKRKDGTVVDGKEIFPEIMRGDIRSAGFDLNGCRVPYYNWHTLYTGLFDVIDHIGPSPKAMAIAVALGGYIDRVFAALSDDQVQAMLACEYGGLNESFAELHARTGDARWLRLAERIYDRRNLDPLTQKRDQLDILIDNQRIATQTLNADRPGAFFDVDYLLPEPLTRGKSRITVRFVPHEKNTAGPVFGVRLFTARPATPGATA